MSTTRRGFFGSAGAVGAAAALLAQPASSAADAPRTTRNFNGWLKVADGTELFVRDWGAGRPVIFTHAWPMSADCWDQIGLELLDAGYRVISYDRRGFGRSTQPASGYSYDQFSDDLAAVIRATGARDVALVGFSMGGGEVVRYFSRHAGRGVKQAALVATVVPGLAKSPDNPDGIDPAAFEGFIAALRRDRLGFLSGLLRDAFYGVKGGTPDTSPAAQAVVDWTLQQGMQASPLALIESVKAFAREDFTPDLPSVTVPTLVLHGDADIPVPIEITARRAARGIRNAKLIEYPGVGHGLLVTERERIAKDLLAFLGAA
jgi:non-heme chloroperoxidase